MTNLQLLDILGSVNGKYILEAQQLRAGVKKPKRARYLQPLAAVIALILMLTFFLTTAPGVAAVSYVKEKVVGLIESLFPPKTISVPIEGETYEGNYIADGVEPDNSAEGPQPGFAIYYDADHYTLETVGDKTYIRPYLKAMTREEVLEVYGDYLSLLSDESREQQIASLMNPQPAPTLPVCEIEIIHLDIPYEQEASQARAELELLWEIQEHTDTNHITFSMHQGSEWDSPVEVRDYLSDEQGGCFCIIRRYYTGAAEGHGAHFAAIVNTFAVIPDSAS